MLLISQQHSSRLFNKNYFLIVLCMCFYHFKTSYSQTNQKNFVITDSIQPDRSEQLVPCHIPTGRASFCVPSVRCKQLNALFSNLQKPIPIDVGKYIKESFFCPSSENVCCPFNSIINPKPANRPPIPNRDEECTVQGGETGSCTVYFQCPPLLQLLSNLRRPFPAELPRLMQSSILCGRENVGGLNLPKVCCPKDAVKTTPTPTTTIKPEPTTPSKPTDAERFAAHANRGYLAAVCPVELSSRIVGGEEAPMGAYPWLALLGYSTGRGQRAQWKCGGALIGDQYILTAAHCVTGLPGSFKLTKIRLGEHTISNVGQDCSSAGKKDCNLGPQDFDVEKVITHPSYNSPNIFQNDIALVKLKGKIAENNFVKPICLPLDDDVNEDYLKHKNGKAIETWVAGWGATDPRGRHTADRLQHINMTIFDGSECRTVYKKRGGTLSEESQLCAGGRAGRDSCVGDSGSALMTAQKEPGKNFPTWKLLGVVSFGPRICGTANVPGVYSRARHYIDWILDNLGS